MDRIQSMTLGRVDILWLGPTSELKQELPCRNNPNAAGNSFDDFPFATRDDQPLIELLFGHRLEKRFDLSLSCLRFGQGFADLNEQFLSSIHLRDEVDLLPPGGPVVEDVRCLSAKCREDQVFQEMARIRQNA